MGIPAFIAAGNTSFATATYTAARAKRDARRGNGPISAGGQQMTAGPPVLMQ